MVQFSSILIYCLWYIVTRFIITQRISFCVIIQSQVSEENKPVF